MKIEGDNFKLRKQFLRQRDCTAKRQLFNPFKVVKYELHRRSPEKKMESWDTFPVIDETPRESTAETSRQIKIIKTFTA